MARIDHRDILTRYLADEHVDVGAAMRSLPATIDVELAANAVVDMMSRPTPWGSCSPMSTARSKPATMTRPRSRSGRSSGSVVRAADKLGIAWKPFEVSRSLLRGKKRDAIAHWLQPRAKR